MSQSNRFLLFSERRYFEADFRKLPAQTTHAQALP